METRGAKTPSLVSFPSPSEIMTIRFERLPDNTKPEAAAALLAGKTWFHWGHQAEHPGDDELKRWIPASAGNGFVGICGTDSATSRAPASGNDSTSGMMKNVKVCKYPEGGIQRLKRKRADILLAARADLSNRELARLAGVSHTYIAKRRRVATNAPTA
jgi:hypothetical protein